MADKKSAKKVAAPEGTILRLIRTKTTNPVYGQGCKVRGGIYVQIGPTNMVVTHEVFAKRYEWA